MNVCKHVCYKSCNLIDSRKQEKINSDRRGKVDVDLMFGFFLSTGYGWR